MTRIRSSIIVLIATLHLTCRIFGDKFDTVEPSANLEKDQIRILIAEICEHQKFSIKCPEHTSVQIEKAVYGHDDSRSYCRRAVQSQEDELLEDDSSCRWTKDFYKKFADLCDGREECSSNVTIKKFLGRLDKQSDCGANNRALILDYRCKPSQFMNDNVCSGASLDLKCRRLGQKIAVYSASYGEKVKLRSSCDDGLDEDDCSINVDFRLMKLCHGQYTCTVNVTDADLGSLEHCSGKGPKILNIIHICVDESIFDVGPVVGSNEVTIFHKIWPLINNKESITSALPNQQRPMIVYNGQSMDEKNWYKNTESTTEATRLNDDSQPKKFRKKFNKKNVLTSTQQSAENNDIDKLLIDIKCHADKKIDHENSDSCLDGGKLVNFVLLFDNVEKIYSFLLRNKAKSCTFFGLSAAAALIFSLVIFALYAVTRQPKNHRRRQQGKPDLIPLPNLPLKIIDPLTLSVDDAPIYQSNRYATLRKSGTISNNRSNYHRSSIIR